MSRDPSGEAGAGPERGESAHAHLSLSAAVAGRHLEDVGAVRGAQWGGSMRNAVGTVVPDFGGGVH